MIFKNIFRLSRKVNMRIMTRFPSAMSVSIVHSIISAFSFLRGILKDVESMPTIFVVETTRRYVGWIQLMRL